MFRLYGALGDESTSESEGEDEYEIVHAQAFLNLSDAEHQSSNNHLLPNESSVSNHDSANDNLISEDSDEGEDPYEEIVMPDENEDLCEEIIVPDEVQDLYEEIVMPDEGEGPNEEMVVTDEEEDPYEDIVLDNEGEDPCEEIVVPDEGEDPYEEIVLADEGEAPNEEIAVPYEREGPNAAIVVADEELVLSDEYTEEDDENRVVDQDNNTINEDDGAQNQPSVEQDLTQSIELLKQVLFKDEIIEQLVNQNTQLLRKVKLARATKCDFCVVGGPICTNHFIPVDNLELKYFRGHERSRYAKKWLKHIEKLKMLYKWSDNMTIEIARMCLFGEASVWADDELQDNNNNWYLWRTNFQLKFFKPWLLRYFTCESFVYFLNYQEMRTTQTQIRRVISRCEYGVEKVPNMPSNPFESFRSNEQTLEELANMHKRFYEEAYVIPDDLVQLNLVVKTRVDKVRELDRDKLMNDPTLNKGLAKKIFRQMAAREKIIYGNGPYSEPEVLHPEREVEFQNVLSNKYFYIWTEWWMHICLWNRITTRIRHTEVIHIGGTRFKGYIDLHMPYSTIVSTAAAHKNFDIDLNCTPVSIVYPDGSIAYSISFFYANVCLKPYNLTGRAMFRIVPAGSQSVPVIVGRSLARFPLYYWDEDYRMPANEREKMLRECPEREYPNPRLEQFQGPIGDVFEQ